MKKIIFLCLGFGLLSFACSDSTTTTPPPKPTPAAINVYLPPLADQPMNKLVSTVVLPRLEALIEQVVQQKGALMMDGVNPFMSSDQFLPGKVAIGFADLLLSKCQDTTCPMTDPAFQTMLGKYRDLSHWVLTTPLGAMNRVFFNQTWGMYYYSNAIARLKTAGLVNPGDPTKDDASAIAAADLDVLKTQLEWRVMTPDATPTMSPFGFVNAHTDGSLANNLPTNYYGVAFGIARNRVLMGWEDTAGADLIFQKLTAQFDTYSGFGYSDETTGEGRFDRYSLLVMGEISQRMIETGVEVPTQLKTWLRNAVDGQLQMLNLSGNGFEYGRSLGPYADTSFLEVLSAAAFLNVLTADEKKLAYAFCTRVVAKYIDFWFDKDLAPNTGGTVNMWKKGRRTDAYRAENRILGENLSLIHQLLYTTAIWNRVLKDEVPMPAADFEAALGQRDRYHLITFTQAPNAPRTDPYAGYDRKSLVVRDGHRVLTLPIVNGGRTLYAFNPYYPVPQSTFMLDATPDLAWPQLLPEMTVTEADGTTSLLKPLAYFKKVTGSEDAAAKTYTLTYHMDELAKLTEPLNSIAPMPDMRIMADTKYTFEPGKVTRTDTYAARDAAVALASIKMQFGTYSTAGAVTGDVVSFAASGDATRDAVKSIEVTGLGVPTIEAVAADNAQFNTNNGPLRSVVTWTAPATTLEAGKPLTITWVLTYDPL